MLNRGLLRFSSQNLLRQRKRNLAAGLAIGLGFAGLLLLGGYVYRAENLIRVTTIFGSRLGHLVVYSEGGLQGYFAKPWQFSLSPEDQETIAAVAAETPGVTAVGRVLLGYGLVGNGCKSFPFSAWGLEPELDHQIAQHPDYLRWAGNVSQVSKGQDLNALPPDEGPILLASGLARLLGKSKTHEELQRTPAGHDGDGSVLSLPDCQAPTAKEDFAKDANVQLMSNTWDGHLSILDGEVVGHYFSGRVEHENTGLIAPLSLLQNLFGTKNVSFMTIWFDDLTHLDQKKTRLASQLAAAEVDVEIYQWSDEAINQFYSGTISFLYTMSLFIGSVMALVIVLSIVNAVSLTILDRKREIGMLRAVGFKVATVMRLYMFESALLAVASLAFGGLVGYLAMQIVNGLDLRYQPPGISSPIPLVLVPNIWISLWLSLVVFVLVMTSTFVAAFRSFRRPILYLMESGNR